MHKVFKIFKNIIYRQKFLAAIREYKRTLLKEELYFELIINKLIAVRNSRQFRSTVQNKYKSDRFGELDFVFKINKR